MGKNHSKNAPYDTGKYKIKNLNVYLYALAANIKLVCFSASKECKDVIFRIKFSPPYQLFDAFGKPIVNLHRSIYEEESNKLVFIGITADKVSWKLIIKIIDIYIENIQTKIVYGQVYVGYENKFEYLRSIYRKIK